MSDITYTFTIKSINISEGTFVIEYTPDDSLLMPVSYNTFLYEKNYQTIRDENNNLIYNSQDEVPFSVHLDHTVKSAAPIDLWRRHKLLLDNVAVLQSLM